MLARSINLKLELITPCVWRTDCVSCTLTTYHHDQSRCTSRRFFDTLACHSVTICQSDWFWESHHIDRDTCQDLDLKQSACVPSTMTFAWKLIRKREYNCRQRMYNLPALWVVPGPLKWWRELVLHAVSDCRNSDCLASQGQIAAECLVLDLDRVSRIASEHSELHSVADTFKFQIQIHMHIHMHIRIVQITLYTGFSSVMTPSRYDWRRKRRHLRPYAWRWNS